MRREEWCGRGQESNTILSISESEWVYVLKIFWYSFYFWRHVSFFQIKNKDNTNGKGRKKSRTEVNK